MLVVGDECETKGKQGQEHKIEPGMYLVEKVHTTKWYIFSMGRP